MRPPPSPGKVEGLQCAEEGCAGVLNLWWSPTSSVFFYGCTRHPKCPGSLPANKDGSPRGKPRKKSLQRARVAAHSCFDSLWKEKHVTRTQAYVWLQEVMNLPADQAHMYQMSEEQCVQVLLMVCDKGPGTPFWEDWKARNDQKTKRSSRSSSV